MIALRFAGDDELEELLEAVLGENLPKASSQTSNQASGAPIRLESESRRSKDSRAFAPKSPPYTPDWVGEPHSGEGSAMLRRENDRPYHLDSRKSRGINKNDVLLFGSGIEKVA